MELIVLLDQNERHIDLLFHDFETPIKRCSLPVGDIWILIRLSGETKFRLWMVIERKAKQDAIKSTSDQRYRDQKLRLSSCPSISHSRIVWLFEMSEREWLQKEVQHCGMQASLLAHGIIPQRTSCASATVSWLRSLVRKLKEHLEPHSVEGIPPLLDLLVEERDAMNLLDQDKDHASMYRPCIAMLLDLQGSHDSSSSSSSSDSSLQKEGKKRKRYLDHVGPTRLIKGANTEPGGDYLNALAAVRGMSVEKARAIACHFPSLVEFVEKGLDQDTLAAIQVQTATNKKKGSTRRLGPKLAGRLIKMAKERVIPS